MRRTLLSVAVLASVFGGVGQARANFIGTGSCAEGSGNHHDGIKLLNSDGPAHSFSWTSFESDLPKNWNLKDQSKKIDCDWNRLANFDLNEDDFKCPNRHQSHPSVDPTVTPSIPPTVTPGIAVPLPAGAWMGLVGVAAVGLATAARRKVAAV